MICVGYSKRVSYLCFKETVPIKEQNDRIRDFAKKQGWKIERFYEDKSNDPDSDQGFQTMRIDGMNHKFDMVILDSMYRCGKNVGFAKELLYRTFYKLGIHFIVLEDNINTTNMAPEEVEQYFCNLRYSVAGLNGNVARKQNLTANRQIDHMKERYGYLLNKDQTEMLIDEEAASVIRLIYEKIDEGKSRASIARYLNEQKIETPAVHLYRVGIMKPEPRFFTWTPGCIHRITHCEFYTGGEDTQLGGRVFYPRIIEPDLYKRVSEKVTGKTRGLTLGKRISNIYKDRIIYGPTGENLYCRAKRIDGKDVVIFHRRCKKVPVIYYEDIIDQIIPMLRKEQEEAKRMLAILNSERRNEIVEEMKNTYKSRARELFIQSVQAQEGNVENYLRYEKGEISEEEYEEVYSEIMDRQEEVNAVFHEMMEEIYEKQMLLSKYNPWIERFCKFDLSGEIEKRAIYELTKQIEVYPDRKVFVVLNTYGKNSFPKELLMEVRNGEEE